MLFLLVLCVLYGLTWLVPRDAGRTDRWRWALAGAMVVAGIGHLAQPVPFLQHLPPWVPAREALVLVSGLAEIALGVALVSSARLRPVVGVLLAAFLVAVFPANVYVAVSGVEVDGQPGGPYPWVRLFVQPLLVWLALWSTRRSERRTPTAEVAT